MRPPPNLPQRCPTKADSSLTTPEPTPESYCSPGPLVRSGALSLRMTADQAGGFGDHKEMGRDETTPEPTQRRPTKADSSLTTPEPTPESYCSPGPLVRSGALSLRMTADQAGGFGDHKEMGRDETTPEPTQRRPTKADSSLTTPEPTPESYCSPGPLVRSGALSLRMTADQAGGFGDHKEMGRDETTPEPTQRRPTKADSSLTTPEPTPESYCSPGPLVRSGALSLRMTADQAGGFGDHKEMGRDETTPEPTQRRPTKADSSLTTPEPTPESYCSPGPLVRSGALSLRMTADQAGGFGDHKEMGRDETTPEPTQRRPTKADSSLTTPEPTPE